MAPKNIKVTKEFAKKTEDIIWRKDVLSLKIPGKKSEQIRTVLTKFVYTKLEDVNPTVYLRLKKRGKLKEDEMTFKGGNEKTVERVYTEQSSSIDLFDIIGSYLYEDKWNEERQNFVIDKNVIEKFDIDSSRLVLNEPINWEGHFRKIYREGAKFNIIPIIGSDILDLKELSMDEYFGEISYTPLNVLHQKEMLLLKEKQQAKRYKSYIESLQNDEFLTQNNLQDFDRILILGNPGTGKTIYSRWLCNQWATGKVVFEGVPVHIELKEVNFEEDKPLLHYLNNLFENKLNLIIGETSFSQKDIAQFFFILDGFDEITPNQQEQLLELIFEKNKGVRFMLLTRPYAMLGYEKPLEVDTIFEILGFGKSSQKLYTERILSGNGENSNSKDFWELTNKHPFLSEFLSTPLTLSYLLILFIEQERNNENIVLENINSTYTLQHQVLYSIRKHFVEKAKKKKNKINREQSFDQAFVNGGGLAYSMEQKSIFVVISTDPKISHWGGYECLIKLNKVGFGRLEFITKEKKRDLNGERGTRFSFITATIQEYLAACNFTEEESNLNDFLSFFSNSISWNFCKMVIGKCVYDKEIHFLEQLNNVLKHNWIESKNVNNVYRYLLFFGELDQFTLNKFFKFNLFKGLFEDVIQIVSQRPLWKNLFYVVLSKIVLKIPRDLKFQFIELYCRISNENIELLLQSDFLDEELGGRIEVMIDIAEITVLNQSNFLIEEIINWIDKVNSVVVKKEQNDTNSEIIIIRYLIYIANRYTFLLEGSNYEMIIQIQNKLKEILELKQKTWHPKIEPLLRTFLFKGEPIKDFFQLKEELLGRLENETSIDDLDEILEKLVWQIEAGFLNLHEITKEEVQSCGVLVDEVITRIGLYTLKDELETPPIRKFYLLLMLLNKFYSLENYDLLYFIICTGMRFDNKQIFLFINYTKELEIFISDSIEYAAFIKSDKDRLSEYVCLLKLLYHIQPGVLFFSKYRLLFYSMFEKFLIQEQKGGANQELVDCYYEYYERLVYRENSLDKSFIVNKLLTSNICESEYVQEEFLVPLFSTQIPICQDKYWDYFFDLWNRTKDVDLFIQILDNSNIYIYRNNLKYLAEAWNWFYHHFFQEIGAIIEDSYNIFGPITKVLSFIEKSFEIYSTDVFAVLKIVGFILKSPKCQGALKHLEEEDAFQKEVILSYLLILKFEKSNLNPYLKKYLLDGKYNRKEVFLFLIELFDVNSITYLQPYISNIDYKMLKDLQDYYKDIDIDKNV